MEDTPTLDDWLQARHSNWNTPTSLINEYVRKATGSAAQQLSRVVLGVDNEVYDVTTAGNHRLIVRISHKENHRFEAERWALHAARLAGVPTPQVLLVEQAEYDSIPDLGYGAGRDTRYLLQQGFQVTAVDKEPRAIAQLADLPQQNLRLVESSFQDFSFETYDLVNAHFALPFNPKDSFDEVFARVKASIRPGGVFVGQLFGIHDEWNKPGSSLTFHTREQAEELFTGMKVIEFKEEDVDSHIADGTPKHWHVFHIIAQKDS